MLRNKLHRKQMFEFFMKCPPTVIGIEACGALHYLVRLLISLGHKIKLIAPQFVKPYVKRGQNDAADAEAICEAMSRPTMCLVPIKSEEDEAALMLINMRERLVRVQTQLANTIRGHAAEFGLTEAKGLNHVRPLLERIAKDEALPAMARDLFTSMADEFARCQERIKEVDGKIRAWCQDTEVSRRLAAIPGVGPIGLALLVMKKPAPELFASGR